MRKLLVLILVSFSFLAKSQVPAGLPSPNSTGFAKYGYLKTDSAGIAALRDTSFNPKYSGTWVYWQNAGVDSSFWVFNGASSGRRWGKVVMVTSTGTGYVMYSDTSTMLSPYLRKYDTTAMLSKYLRTYDTTAMLAGYIRNTKIGVTVQPYNASTTLLGNTTTGSGSTIVLNGSPTLITPSIAAINVSGGIASLPTGSGTLAYRSDTGRAVSALTTGGALNKVRDSVVNLISAGGFGTVLSVATTNGVGIISSVASPTTSPNISIRVDTNRTATSIVTGGSLNKVRDSITGLTVKYSDTTLMLSTHPNQTYVDSHDALKVNISDTAAQMSGYRRKSVNITNADLVNSTISGTSLGGTLPNLNFGTYLQAGATSYNGSTAVTMTTNATSSNLGSTLVARDLNGDFFARNVNAALIGNSSSTSTAQITDDITTNAAMYPLFSPNNSGYNSLKSSSAKLAFNPSTGVLTSSFAGSLTGNATTASTLQTPRTINGVAFDGSANITISASVANAISAGYGLTGSNYDGSLARTWTADTTKVIPYTDTLAIWGIASKGFIRNGFLPLTGGTLSGSLIGTSATFSSGINATQNGNLSSSYALYLKRLRNYQSLGYLIQAQDSLATTNLFTVDVNGNVVGTSFAGAGTGITGLTNSNLSGTAGITNANLANSTISGVSLGSNLANLTNGWGVLGGTYNGSSAIALNIDTASYKIATKTDLLSYVKYTDTATALGSHYYNKTWIDANLATKQATISLTTTGSSGSSTLVGATLNVPTYTLAGLGGQPLATNLTSIGGLANAAGVLYNNGTGTFSYTTVPTLTGTNFSGIPYSAMTGTVPTWNQNTTGNAATVTTNANLTGIVTSVGNATSIAANAITDGYISSATNWNTAYNTRVQSGLLSARPLTGTAGRYYYATDNGITYYDNGTAWVIMVGALSGDITTAANGLTTTLATVNANVGSFGSASSVATFTVNAKGLITSAASTGIQIAESQVTGLVTDLSNKQPLATNLTSLAALSYTAGTHFVKMTAAGTFALDNSTYLTGNQSITWTASNDVSGSASGTTAISPALTVTGLRSVALPALLLGGGLLKYTGTTTNTWVFDTNTYLTTAVTSVSGTGTVSGLTLTGTVTTTGNLTLGGTLAVTSSNFASQTANTVLAAPNGIAGVPTFRVLVAADIPALSYASPSATFTLGTTSIALGSTTTTVAGLSSIASSKFISNSVGIYATQSSDGQYQLYATVNEGLTVAGRGTTYDMILVNKSGQTIAQVPTGTRDFQVLGTMIGNASTATLAANSTLWNGLTYYGGGLASTVSFAMVYDATNSRQGVANAAQMQSFLGLGSNAYTSTAYLPLTGGTLTGSLSGTIATLSSSTASTSTSTGALVVTGGVGVGGSMFVGGNINATGALGGSSVIVNGTVQGLDIYFSTNNHYMYGRNAANSLNKSIIGINASDKINIDADALGTVFGGTVNANQYSSTVQTLTDGVTVTFNATNGSNAVVTLGGNRTLAWSNTVAGTYYTLRVIQDATGSRTLTLPAGSKVIGGGSGAITLSTAANAVDLITFYYDGTNYYITYGTNYN